MKIVLGTRLIKAKIALAKETGKRIELWDAMTLDEGGRRGNGLHVVVIPSGTATFYVRYRPKDGGPHRRHKIGRFGVWTIEKARREASDILAQVDRGLDPAGKRKANRDAMRFHEVADRFMRDHGPKLKPRTVDAYRKLLDLHIHPSIGRVSINTLGRDHVAKLHSHVGASSPGAANRVLALVSVICTHAEDWGLRPSGSNPARFIKRFPEKGAGHYLDAAELARLDAAITAAENAAPGQNDTYVAPGACRAIRLALHTGMRVGELTGLQWSMVDLERARLHLPDSKTGRKSVPLSPIAVDLLRDAAKAAGANPWVCPGRDGGPLHNLQRAWRSVRRNAKLDHVRLHDLRHSFASLALEGGASLELVGAVLGHHSPLTTRRYAHFADKALAATVELHGEALTQKIAAGQQVALLPVAPKREPAPKRKRAKQVTRGR